MVAVVTCVAAVGVVATACAPGPDLAGPVALPPVTTESAPTTAAVTDAAPSTTVVSVPPTTLAPLAPPRVGVFGDSTAIRMGQGLAAYGQRTGAFEVVVNFGRVGCGVERGGQRRFQGSVFTLVDFCGELDERWAEAVAERPIDVVVVQTGMWETVERRLPGDAHWRRIGDPVLDSVLRGEILAADAFWAGRSIPVVWVRAPTPSYLERDPGTMERFNELLEQAVAFDTTATTVTLDRYLDGLSAAEKARLRPDGIHFTPDTAVLVADTWLGPQVSSAIDQVRRAALASRPG